jgi:hypothetical protein
VKRRLPRIKGEEAAQAIARAMRMPWWPSVRNARPVNAGNFWVWVLR